MQKTPRPFLSHQNLFRFSPAPGLILPDVISEANPLLDRWNDLLKKYSTIAQWLLVLITVAVFRGMLANGFVYDDGRQVLENPFVRNPRRWRNIFTGSVWSFLGQAAETNFYRPLHIFSHWLVWRVAGADPGLFISIS